MPAITHEPTPLPSQPRGSIERLRQIDQKHANIKQSHIEQLSQGFPFNVDNIEFQIANAVDYIHGKLPQNPTVSDVEKNLSRLVNTVDSGGKLHAALTHAVGINRVQDAIHPLPALPEEIFVDPAAFAVKSKRELAIVKQGFDSVEEAINRFRAGLDKNEYHYINEVLRTNRHYAPFYGEVLGRAEVNDILDMAALSLPRLRSNALEKESQLEHVSVGNNTEITPEQKEIIYKISYGFVVDMVRDAQKFLRSNNFFFDIRKSKEDPSSPIDPETGRSLREIEREKKMSGHIDSIMNEMDVDKEPLRFATAWTTDKHAHDFIRNLPSYTNSDLGYLDSAKKLVDFTLVKHLQEYAFPENSFRENVEQAIETEVNNSILRHPVARLGIATGLVFLHMNPHYLPIPPLRRMIASRTWLCYALGMQANSRLFSSYIRLLSKPVVAITTPKTSVPQRMLLNSIRKKNTDMPFAEHSQSPAETIPSLYSGFLTNMQQVKQNLPAELYL